MLIACPQVQIVNMSSGLASKANLAANMMYPHAAKMGLAYRSSKAALCMGKPQFQGVQKEPYAVDCRHRCRCRIFWVAGLPLLPSTGQRSSAAVFIKCMPRQYTSDVLPDASPSSWHCGIHVGDAFSCMVLDTLSS